MDLFQSTVVKPWTAKDWLFQGCIFVVSLWKYCEFVSYSLQPFLAVAYLVVHPDVKSVVKEPVVEEPVGQEERDEDNDQVQELTEDETEVVDVVLVVDVVGEKLKIYE